MDGALLTVALLACPVGMGAMMWFMMGGQHGKTDAQHQASAQRNDEIAELREELRILSAEDALQSGPSSSSDKPPPASSA